MQKFFFFFSWRTEGRAVGATRPSLERLWYYRLQIESDKTEVGQYTELLIARSRYPSM